MLVLNRYLQEIIMHLNIVTKNRHALCSDLLITNMHVKLLYSYKGGKVFNFKFLELFYNRPGT